MCVYVYTHTPIHTTLPPRQETKKDGQRRHCKWCSKYKPDRRLAPKLYVYYLYLWQVIGQ